MENWTKRPEENEYEFVYRIGSNKDSVGTWQDVADICNRELGYEYTESRYRKMFQAFSNMMDNQTKMRDPSAYTEDLREIRREIEKERKKLQTEKLEYNKWLREEARDEMILEAICEEIRNLPPLDLPDPRPQEDYTGSTKHGILLFGDEHFGCAFTITGLYGEVLNTYSPEVFYNRMGELLMNTVAICEKEGLDTISVYSMGDFADGILRVGQLMKLQYGVVESTVRYADYICDWLNELTRHVNVRFQMARGGNHTQLRLLGQPKGTFEKENMDQVVLAMIKTRLQDNPNFEVTENPTGYIFETVCGLNVFGLHGEVKSLAQAMKDFSNTYKTPIDILVAGHKHHAMSEAVGLCREVVGIPSIMGIDDFAMKLNSTSNAGATFLVIEPNKGKTIEYSIRLN